MNGISTYTRGVAQRKQMHYSPNLLSTVNNAIDNRLVAIIEYDSKDKGITTREIEPMALVYKDRRRNLVAWCRLRCDYRSFRLDRLNMIKVRLEEFARRENFRIEDYQDAGANTYGEEFEEEDQ
ncbi:MAG: WYL domain-containing protein [Bacteroidetes bacterium]|nr:WYL domain-containing protein [Bacteroidota bacterium]